MAEDVRLDAAPRPASAGGATGPDAVEYYAHLRSLYQDHDVDFANEFEHFGILTRYDKIRPTVTGHRRTIFSVGPALLWLPFYALGDAVARVQGDLQDGYAPAHVRAVCLGSLFYGVVGLLLLHALLASVVPRATATVTVLLLQYATFLYWYVVYEPVMSHAGSFFCAALVLWTWWPGRRALSTSRALVTGALIGLAATVRWQNAVLLLLPAASLLVGPDGPVAWWRARRNARASTPGLALALVPGLRLGAGVLLAFVFGVSPQLLAWKAVFGSFLLADPPHGRDFLRLDHPYLLETFFSSRHGLFYWTPLLWGAYLGVGLLWRRERLLGLMLGVPIVLMTWVNVCSGDWWAGGSFSNRRFDSLLPLLAVGLALTLEALVRVVRRRPAVLPVMVGASLTLWNVLFMQQVRRNLIPRDESIAFARVAENSAALFADALGAPVAWPANWIFARRFGLPAAQYDEAVGKYLFYRQNNLGGVLDLGDARCDPALLDAGWTSLRTCGPGAVCRGVMGQARLFAPLDGPEDLEVVVHAAGRGTLALAVNGRPVAVLPLSETQTALAVRVPAGLWQRELNELRFTTDAAPGDNTAALVDKLVFRRLPREARP